MLLSPAACVFVDALNTHTLSPLPRQPNQCGQEVKKLKNSAPIAPLLLPVTPAASPPNNNIKMRRARGLVLPDPTRGLPRLLRCRPRLDQHSAE